MRKGEIALAFCGCPLLFGAVPTPEGNEHGIISSFATASVSLVPSPEGLLDQSFKGKGIGIWPGDGTTDAGDIMFIPEGASIESHLQAVVK